MIGPIRGIHVHILAGGHVEGDVINETLSVENGAYIDGKIRRSEDPLSEPIAAGYFWRPGGPPLSYPTMAPPPPPPPPPPPRPVGGHRFRPVLLPLGVPQPAP